jgi:hypothetical protein
MNYLGSEPTEFKPAKLSPSYMASTEQFMVTEAVNFTVFMAFIYTASVV